MIIVCQQCRKSHHNDNIISLQSYLCDKDFYTWKDILYIETGTGDDWFLRPLILKLSIFQYG